MSKSTIPYYLYDHIKKKINLADFLESEIGCKLQWTELNVSAKTICPIPSHKEKKPSFCVSKAEDGVWLYLCWGCGVKGTVIDFFMDYYDLSSAEEAVSAICKKFDIKNDAELATGVIKDVKKKVNVKKKMECAHIVASNQCRCLLRKNYDKNSKWVAEAYRKMNKALDNDDIDVIESVGFEASERMEK